MSYHALLLAKGQITRALLTLQIAALTQGLQGVQLERDVQRATLKAVLAERDELSARLNQAHITTKPS